MVIEGPLAGGHLGFKKEDIFNEEYSLEKLVPEVVAQAKELEDKHGKPVPVIAAGDDVVIDAAFGRRQNILS